MRPQHKKLYDAIQTELERNYERSKNLPQTGMPYAFLCGRYFTYGRVARNMVYNRRYQELANLCQERIAIGPYLGVPTFLRDEFQRFPLHYHVQNKAEHAAYSEILALLKLYVGVEPTKSKRCDCPACSRTVYGKSAFCEKVPA